MYLLDTNTCIDFALARSDALKSRMAQALPTGLSVSAITFAELSVGARQTSDPFADSRRLLSLGRLLMVEPFDQRAAEIYARVVRLLGFRRRSFDRLIAAHALALGAILVTNNERDFADVPGLAVENWTR